MRPFRVGYVDRPPHPQFFATIAEAPGVALIRIDPGLPTEAGLESLAGCDAYYAMASRDELPRPYHVDAALLARLPELLLVASTGAGYDTCDPVACTDAGVLLINQAGGNAQAVAEHAIGMMLALLKRMPENAVAIREGRAGDRAALIGRELHGRTVGLIGLGHVGTRTAEILRLAFGVRVLAHDPYLDDAAVIGRGAVPVSLDALLAESDVVSLHCPLTPETRGMIDAAALARMRPGAILVTTARGEIHDEAAVLDALRSGHLGGAGLDVWKREPPAPDHPLLAWPSVLATQHTAGVTQESRANISRIAALALGAVARGETPPRIVNPAVLPHWQARLAQRLKAA